MKICDIRLFFTYAHPCAEVIVARGAMKQSELDEIRASLLTSQIPKQPPSIFRTAYRFLEFYAKQNGKASIDAETIRNYFWSEHDDFVMEECTHRHDLCADKCIVYPGKVEAVTNNYAEVSTPLGIRKINISFTPKITVGDFVTIHYGYSCERISKKDFEKLWSEKS